MKKFYLLLLSIFWGLSISAQSDTTHKYHKPEPINMREVQMKISYPPLARESGIMGDIVLNVSIDEKGEYVSHDVLCSAHPILLKAVEKHISALKFTPATLDDKPIKFKMEVPFKFKLQRGHTGEVKITNIEQLKENLAKIEVESPNYTQVIIHLDKNGKYESHSLLWQKDSEIGNKVIDVLKTATYDILIPSKRGFTIYVLISYKKTIGRPESESKQVVNITYFQEQ